MLLTFNEMNAVLSACRALAGRKLPFAYAVAKNVKTLGKKVDEETELYREEFSKYCIQNEDGKPKDFILNRDDLDAPEEYTASQEQRDLLAQHPETFYVGHILDPDSREQWERYSKEFLERKHEVEIHHIDESSVIGFDIEPDLLFPLLDTVIKP